MKIKFLTIFVIVILGLSVAPLSFAATKSKVSSASKKTIQTVKKPVPTKKKVSLIIWVFSCMENQAVGKHVLLNSY